MRRQESSVGKLFSVAAGATAGLILAHSVYPIIDDVRHAYERVAATYTATPLPGVSASRSQSPNLAPTDAPTIESSPSPITNESTAPTPTASEPAPQTRSKKVIVIDPGHNGKAINSVDERTGIFEKSGRNWPETKEVFEVSLVMKAIFENKGYEVYLTKKDQEDTVRFYDRAQLAIDKKADIMVIVHDDHSVPVGRDSMVSQKLGQYRMKSDNTKSVMDNKYASCVSHEYTDIVANTRSEVSGRKVSTIDFDSRSGMADGNIPLNSLFAGQGGVPVVYGELGAAVKMSDGKLNTTQELTQAQKNAYAEEFAAGVIKAMEQSEQITKACKA